ncbi:unnamed protein product [Lathyrus sativus]|nr:unnamed protein product [Lathyrus sativus]
MPTVYTMVNLLQVGCYFVFMLYDTVAFCENLLWFLSCNKIYKIFSAIISFKKKYNRRKFVAHSLGMVAVS